VCRDHDDEPRWLKGRWGFLFPHAEISAAKKRNFDTTLLKRLID